MQMLNSKNKFNLWRYLLNFWSIVLYILIFYDFIENNALADYLAPFAAIYIAILAIYVSDKEFERWNRLNHNGRHPGELFIAAWTVLIFFLIISAFILSKPYKLPTEITSTYIAALSILAITQKSKSLYRKKREE